MKKTYHLGATAAFGLEGVVANELKRMGFDAKGFHGGATFDGTLEDAFRANLWLRAADRVLLYFGRFKAVTFDSLLSRSKCCRGKSCCRAMRRSMSPALARAPS